MISVTGEAPKYCCEGHFTNVYYNNSAKLGIIDRREIPDQLIK